MELIVEKIDGFSKVFDFILNEKLEDSEKHEWNAVQIDNEWFFIEPNEDSTKWTGKCWYFYNYQKYESK